MAELIGRPKREEEFLSRMSTMTRQQKKRLLEIAGDPPDWSKVPDSFWKKIEQETQQQLIINLFLLSALSMRQHGAKGMADVFGRSYAIKRAAETAAIFVKNSRKILERAVLNANRPTIIPETSGLAKLPEIQKPEPIPGASEAEKVAEEIFGKQRLETLVATETTAAQSAGSEAAAAVIGTSENDIWNTEIDGRQCPTCGKLHETGRSVWMEQFPKGPPAHPNCRCWIIYSNERVELGVLR